MEFLRLFVAKDGYLRDPATRKFVFEKDKGVCKLCGKKVDPSKWDAHHVVPRSKGGSGLSNFAVAHPKCNKVKGNK